MTDVNRTPYNIIPEKWAFDDEVGPFMRELLDVIWQMRNRSGGDLDYVERNDPLYAIASATRDSLEDDGTADALATAAFANAVAEANSKTTIPIGGIILWSDATIPTNYQICDGTGGTPDLRDKFIVGAGSTYALGANSAANIAATASGPTATTVVDNVGGGATVAVASAGHGHTITVNPTIPPYYAAYYIMRMK